MNLIEAMKEQEEHAKQGYKSRIDHIVDFVVVMLCPDCGADLQSSPDGPWCKVCDPDAPTRFATQEKGPF